MKKNPQTKTRQKRVLALVKTKFPRRRKGWGLIVLPFLCCLPLLSNANYTRHHPEMNKLSMSESPTNDTKKETIVIRGIVKDKEGTPLPGVTILIKGSTVFIPTNENDRIRESRFSTFITRFSSPIILVRGDEDERGKVDRPTNVECRARRRCKRSRRGCRYRLRNNNQKRFDRISGKL